MFQHTCRLCAVRKHGAQNFFEDEQSPVAGELHHCLASIGMRGGEKGGHHFVEKTLIGVEVCKRSLMVCKAHRTP